MVRVRLTVIAAAALVLISAGPVSAQNLTGLLTGHIGSVRGGDIRGGGTTPGVSLAVVEESRLGAELDVAHARSFDRERFDESGITSVMLNAIGVWNHPKYQPFIVAGLGVLRARASAFGGIPIASRTDLGADAGVGMMVLFNDTIGVRGDVRYFRFLQRHPDLPVLDNGFFDFWRISVGGTFAWPIR